MDKHDINSSWIDDMKLLHPKEQPVEMTSLANVELLNDKQRQVYNTVMQHAEAGSRKQLLLHVDGRAGTGKTFVFQVLSCHLERNGFLVKRMAPTGVASHGIQVQTLHSPFRLPMASYAFRPLGSSALSLLRRQL